MRALAGSDIVIITSGIPRKPGQTRMDLAQTNVNVIKDIAPQITKYCPDATYIIVSNPVDILTYVFHKVTNIPHERIIGSGTLLDTARLRARLAEYLNVSEKNVHAYVFGEHGETSFIPWSIAQVSTINLLEYKDLIKLRNGILTDLDFDEIEKYMRSSAPRSSSARARPTMPSPCRCAASAIACSAPSTPWPPSRQCSTASMASTMSA